MVSTLDTQQAAAYLHCGETKMLELARSGQIRAAKIGKTYVFRAEWLDRFLEEEADRQAQPAKCKRRLPDLDRYERGAQ